MLGTMKTESGLPFECENVPLYLKGFLSNLDHDNLLEVCEFASRFSRVNLSRITNCRFYSNMPAIQNVQSFFAQYIEDSLGEKVRPVDSTYYAFDCDSIFPLRTTSKNHDFTIFIFLGVYAETLDWPLEISEPVSRSDRASLDFPAGTIQNQQLAEQLLARYAFKRVKPRNGDALLFSGSRCLHRFVGSSSTTSRILCLNFKKTEVTDYEPRQ